MGNGPSADPVRCRIEEALRRMPDLDPPDVLLPSVMGAVGATRLSPWIRILRWFRAPRSITFTPLQLVPPVAVLTVLCLAFAFYALRGEKADLLAQARQVPDLGRVIAAANNRGMSDKDIADVALAVIHDRAPTNQLAARLGLSSLIPGS